MTSVKSLAAGAIFSALATTAGAVPVQWAGNGNYYEVVAGSYLFDAAVSDAASKTYLGATGYVATVTSAAEQSFIDSAFGAIARFWIGASDAITEGDYLWVNGPEIFSPVTYANWAAGQPNATYAGQDHVIMDVGSAEWMVVNGTNGNHRYAYIIEYEGSLPSVPLPAGLPLAAGAFGLLALVKRRKAKKA